MKVTEFISKVSSGLFNETFIKLYGNDRIEYQTQRYINLANGFASLFGDKDVLLFSVPGRTEISGNHTDHNNGKVICGSVDIDIISMVSVTDSNTIFVKSDGYRESVIELDKLALENTKSGTSSSLIAGVTDWFIKNNYKAGGFCAYTQSDVVMGSGISSSAAFEVMIGTILNYCFNDGKINPVEIAKAGKYAENEFFGKPCGLLDQTACAIGGMCYIDFAKPESPYVEKLSFDFESCGHVLCLINTGGSHAKLTDEYASLPYEMKQVAGYFGKSALRFVKKNDFRAAIPELRNQFGDRAVLRALHFFNEDIRVDVQRTALKYGNYPKFFKNVARSGNSSFKYLQNVFSVKSPEEQSISLALALCDDMGVLARVHGGGFAGTAQAWVKPEQKEMFRSRIESVFGEGSCMFLKIRPYGGVCFDDTDFKAGIIR